MSFAPVLLLHGWGGSFASTFAANGWIEAIEQAGRVVLGIDLPGHGRNGGSHDPEAYADLAGGLNAMLPSGPLDVIGYSLGGKLALELQSRQPGRFERMVVGGVGDNAFVPEHNGGTVADALETALPADAPAPVRALVEYSAASRSDPLALAAVLRRRPNPLGDPARFAAITGEVLLVNGTADSVALPDAKLRQSLGPHQYVTLEGVDHFMLPRNPAFQAAATQFLELGADRAIPNTPQAAATR